MKTPIFMILLLTGCALGKANTRVDLYESLLQEKRIQIDAATTSEDRDILQKQYDGLIVERDKHREDAREESKSNQAMYAGIMALLMAGTKMVGNLAIKGGTTAVTGGLG